MNKNYKILNNFPTSLTNTVKTFYIENRETINEDGPYAVWVPEDDNRCVFNRMHPQHPLMEPIRDTLSDLPVFAASIFINPARSGLGPFHIDPKRHAAINIAIKVDLKNSLFFMGEEETCIEMEPPESEVKGLGPGAKRYPYEPEKYAVYNLEKPIILNPQVAHGAANWSDEERAILSVTLDCTYKEALSLLPKEWL